jgi:hypothetical protein
MSAFMLSAQALTGAVAFGRAGNKMMLMRGTRVRSVTHVPTNRAVAIVRWWGCCCTLTSSARAPLRTLPYSGGHQLHRGFWHTPCWGLLHHSSGCQIGYTDDTYWLGYINRTVF